MILFLFVLFAQKFPEHLKNIEQVKYPIECKYIYDKEKYDKELLDQEILDQEILDQEILDQEITDREKLDKEKNCKKIGYDEKEEKDIYTCCIITYELPTQVETNSNTEP